MWCNLIGGMASKTRRDVRRVADILLPDRVLLFPAVASEMPP